MTSELKPCPFCGEKAETHETTDGWIVSCSSDQNVLDGFTHMAHAYGGTEAKAVAEWNKRAERTCEMKFDTIDTWFCSACETELPEDPNHRWYLRYCPNCGARVIAP